MTVSETILNQLGGNKFLAMTGARDLVKTGNSLQFRIPPAPKNLATLCQVTLEADDTYTVTFLKFRRRHGQFVMPQLATVGQAVGIQAEQLAEAFTRHTGLATSL